MATMSMMFIASFRNLSNVSMAGLPRNQSKFMAARKSNPPCFVGANHQPDDELNGEEDDHKIVNHVDDEDNPREVKVAGGILLQLVGGGDDEGDGGEEDHGEGEDGQELGEIARPWILDRVPTPGAPLAQL